MSDTNISYIKPYKKVFNSMSDVVAESERKSDYRNGVAEGIVMKIANDRYVTDSFKVINKYFNRREDFNTVLIKNKTI